MQQKAALHLLWARTRDSNCRTQSKQVWPPLCLFAPCIADKLQGMSHSLPSRHLLLDVMTPSIQQAASHTGCAAVLTRMQQRNAQLAMDLATVTAACRLRVHDHRIGSGRRSSDLTAWLAAPLPQHGSCGSRCRDPARGIITH